MTSLQVLLGQKYGYRPLPTIIAANQMEMLCDVITGEDSQLLQQWYKKDDNSIEPIYVLQTISSILPSFKNKVAMTHGMLLKYQVAAAVAIFY